MIRAAAKTDVPAMLALYAPYVLGTTYTFEYTVPTEAEFTERFHSITEQFPWLVWEEDGQVLGYAYGSAPFHRAAYRWCCEVSIYLVPQAHGKGIGRKLYAALETLLFRQGYRVIYSIITAENTGSLAFHEKVGYRFVAEMPGCGIKFGKELGIIWMEKRANYGEIPTDFPTPWSQIVNNDGKLKEILANLSLS